MSENHVERSRDWFGQAERDLRHAEHSVPHGDHEWACFAAQQCAEKALKAVYESLAGEAKGHSVRKLLEGLQQKINVPEELREIARYLDLLYIPTRYPNGFDSGMPADYFGADNSRQAIEHARTILEFSRPYIP